MILVVVNHVAAEYFGVSYNHSNIHYYISQFMLPLFFFVSGFLIYKDNFNWNIKNSIIFLKKKITMLVISPFIFFCAYLYIKDYSFLDNLFNRWKAGYWFTFALFMYFIIYAIIQYIFKKLKINNVKVILPIYMGIGVFLYFNAVTQIMLKINIPETIIESLGTTNLLYFIFFLCGTLTRKYFTQIDYFFENQTNAITLCIVVFFLLNIFIDLTSSPKIIVKICGLILSLTSTIIVFSIFRKNKILFEKNNTPQRIIKFIGRRTLDIYFLHYFFLYKGVADIFPFFNKYQIPIIEFVCSLLISSIIISTCLFIGYILRLSPTLAHYLFGEKNK